MNHIFLMHGALGDKERVAVGSIKRWTLWTYELMLVIFYIFDTDVRLGSSMQISFWSSTILWSNGLYA